MNPQSYSMLIPCSVKAFHLKFDENATDANVKKWDVHVLTVSSFKTRNRPFLDFVSVFRQLLFLHQGSVVQS